MRLDMLKRPEHRRRLLDILEALAGRPLDVGFELVAAPAPAERSGPEPAPALDHDRLVQELKTMFNAVEEP
jgi:hypothetical protein